MLDTIVYLIINYNAFAWALFLSLVFPIMAVVCSVDGL